RWPRPATSTTRPSGSTTAPSSTAWSPTPTPCRPTAAACPASSPTGPTRRSCSRRTDPGSGAPGRPGPAMGFAEHEGGAADGEEGAGVGAGRGAGGGAGVLGLRAGGPAGILGFGAGGSAGGPGFGAGGRAGAGPGAPSEVRPPARVGGGGSAARSLKHTGLVGRVRPSVLPVPTSTLCWHTSEPGSPGGSVSLSVRLPALGGVAVGAV